ncbi:MAG: NADH-quinone oxidoreductase subunit N [Caldilineaceae bacterium]
MQALGLNLSAVLPEILLVCLAMVVMLVDAFGGEKEGGVKGLIPWLSLLGVIVVTFVALGQWGATPIFFQSAAVTDHFTIGLRLIVLVTTALSILVSHTYIPRINQQTGEYYSLLLLCAAGMMMMGAAVDLMVVFLALEIFSLGLYILTGLHRQSARSTEAAMKYFLLGAFASAFFVYGAALVYGGAGSTNYSEIAATLAAGKGDVTLLLPGIALLLIGFGFKVSLVPFHMWTPDVYQGAPTPVTAFMSVGTKAAAFAAFARVFVEALPSQEPVWGWAMAILAILTMTLGNLAALRQASLKRMLAYSSIAHAGYILCGLVPGTTASADGALAYLFTYAFMNIGAFAVVIALENAGEDDALQQRAKGLGQRWPALAFVMAIFMFSLSGIPPLAGFFGKFYVFKAAVEGGWAWLAAIGMLNSAIGAYYYLRVVVSMYFDSSEGETVPSYRNWSSLRIGMALTAAATVIIGIFPSLWSGIFNSGLGG